MCVCCSNNSKYDEKRSGCEKSLVGGGNGAVFALPARRRIIPSGREIRFYLILRLASSTHVMQTASGLGRLCDSTVIRSTKEQ